MPGDALAWPIGDRIILISIVDSEVPPICLYWRLDLAVGKGGRVSREYGEGPLGENWDKTRRRESMDEERDSEEERPRREIATTRERGNRKVKVRVWYGTVVWVGFPGSGYFLRSGVKGQIGMDGSE